MNRFDILNDRPVPAERLTIVPSSMSFKDLIRMSQEYNQPAGRMFIDRRDSETHIDYINLVTPPKTLKHITVSIKLRTQVVDKRTRFEILKDSD